MPTTEKKRINTKHITMGCDPELIIFDGESKIRADAILYRSEKFGCDGHSSTAELRPDASSDTREVVSNIGSLLLGFKETFPEYSLKAGGIIGGESIGGHIHIGGGLYPELQSKLDIVFEALSHVFEPRAQVEQRRRGSYGRRKEFRRKSWGIEFRTPISWMLSPFHSLLYLGTAKLLTQCRDLDIDTIWKDLRGTSDSMTLTRGKALLQEVFAYFSAHANEYINEDEIIDIVDSFQYLIENGASFSWDNNILDYWLTPSDVLTIEIS